MRIRVWRWQRLAGAGLAGAMRWCGLAKGSCGRDDSRCPDEKDRAVVSGCLAASRESTREKIRIERWPTVPASQEVKCTPGINSSQHRTGPRARTGH